MGNRALPRCLLAMACVLSWTLTTVPASAGETQDFGFNPYPIASDGTNRRSFEFGIAPGGSVRDSVEVYNKTAQPLRMRIYGADASISASGTISIPPFGASPSAVGSWIHVDAPEITLAALARRVVGFRIQRPGSGDGQAGALVAEEVPSAPSSSGLDLVTRVALLVKIESASAPAPGTVGVGRVELVSNLALLPSSAAVKGIVENNTAKPVSAAVRAKVVSITGRVYELAPQTLALAAGEHRQVGFTWTTVPRWGGLMRAIITAAWDQSETSSRSLYAPIVPLWLAIALAALAGGLAALRVVRRRPKKASPAPPAPQPAAAVNPGSWYEASSSGPAREPAWVPPILSHRDQRRRQGGLEMGRLKFWQGRRDREMVLDTPLPRSLTEAAGNSHSGGGFSEDWSRDLYLEEPRDQRREEPSEPEPDDLPTFLARPEAASFPDPEPEPEPEPEPQPENEDAPEPAPSERDAGGPPFSFRRSAFGMFPEDKSKEPAPPPPPAPPMGPPPPQGLVIVPQDLEKGVFKVVPAAMPAEPPERAAKPRPARQPKPKAKAQATVKPKAKPKPKPKPKPKAAKQTGRPRKP